MVHHIVLFLLIDCFIESLFMYSEYYWYNYYGKRSMSFMFINITLLSLRTVIVFIIILLASLGYGTIKIDMCKYMFKIGLLSFF